MKYIIKAQVKPYTRTRKGKLERVKEHSRESKIGEPISSKNIGIIGTHHKVEGRQTLASLEIHKEFMDKYISEGMNKEEASKKALEDVRSPEGQKKIKDKINEIKRGKKEPLGEPFSTKPLEKELENLKAVSKKAWADWRKVENDPTVPEPHKKELLRVANERWKAVGKQERFIEEEQKRADRERIPLSNKIIPVVERLTGDVHWWGISGEPNNFTLDFDSSRFDGLFTPRPEEEDDDDPEFTGAATVERATREAIGWGYRITTFPHEKGLFSVTVKKVDKLGLTKKEREWFDSHLQDGKLVILHKDKYDGQAVVSILNRQGSLKKVESPAEEGKDVYEVKRLKIFSPARMEQIRTKISEKLSKTKAPISFIVKYNPHWSVNPNTITVAYEIPDDLKNYHKYYKMQGYPENFSKEYLKKEKTYRKMREAIDKIAQKYLPMGVKVVQTEFLKSMKYVVNLEKAVQVKGFTRTRKGKMERVKPYSREQDIKLQIMKLYSKAFKEIPNSPRQMKIRDEIKRLQGIQKKLGEPYAVKDHTKEEYKKYIDSLESEPYAVKEHTKEEYKKYIDSLESEDVGEPYSTKDLRHIEIDVKPGTKRTKEWKIKEALEENSNTINSPKYLNAKVKKDINGDLHDISTKYHTQLPIDEIFGALEKRGIVVLQEDSTKFSGFFLGENAQTYFPVAPVGSKDNEFYAPFRNSVLTLGWYKMPSGKYEITTYIG